MRPLRPVRTIVSSLSHAVHMKSFFGMNFILFLCSILNILVLNISWPDGLSIYVDVEP